MLHLLEMYVWAPENLSDSDQGHVDSLLATNEHARDYVQLLASMRDELTNTASPLPDAVAAFAESLYTPPRRIRLERKPVSSVDSSTNTTRRTGFAAAGPAPNARFRSLGSMLNREEGILVRFIHDSLNDEVRGYILCTQESLVEQMLLVVDHGTHVYCPDAQGVVVMPVLEVGDPASLSDRNMDLLLPTQSITIHPDDTGSFKLGASAVVDVRDRALLVHLEESDTVFVTCRSGSASPRRVVGNEQVPRRAGSDAVLRSYALS